MWTSFSMDVFTNARYLNLINCLGALKGMGTQEKVKCLVTDTPANNTTEANLLVKKSINKMDG